MRFDLAQQRRELCRLVCDGKESESFESCAVETPQIVTLVTVSLPATRHQRCSGPESLRVIDRRVKLDHVRTGHDFIQHSQWRWSFGIAQTLDQRLHAGPPQRLDQLVGWGFVSIRQKDYVTRHAT